MFDQHPLITKEELGALFPSGMIPHRAMILLVDEDLSKEELQDSLQAIADSQGDS